MRNKHLEGSTGAGVVQFLKKYKYNGNGVLYLPGDFENFDLSTAKALEAKKIVKRLNK